jgi:hypothetical protein
MMKCALIFIALTLAGCQPTPEQEEKIKAGLPPGCTLKDLGRYGDIDSVLVVTCDDRRTTAINYMTHRLEGKFIVHRRWVTIQ